MGKAFRNLLNSRGQVVIEYALILSVIVAIMFPLLRLVQKRFAAPCPSTSVICKMIQGLEKDGKFGGGFRTFRLPKGAR